MVRKNRSIAGFDQVAGDSTNANNNISDNTSANNNNNVNTNTDDNKNNNVNDKLEQLLNAKEVDRVMKGIYLDRDIAATLEKLGKGKGRKASMSEVVNIVLREKFMENGWL